MGVSPVETKEEVLVLTARRLSAGQLQRLQALVGARFSSGGIVYAEDPSILGGLKVKVGSKLFDASLKTKLDQMKFALKRA